jgi:alpha-galactosidase
MLLVLLVIVIIMIITSVQHKTLDLPMPRLLCPSPPMGWNSWTCFATDINEQLIKDTVDALIDKGLQQYEYVIVDDGWMDMSRDSNGDLQACPVKFPSGMKALGDYIHGKGFKFGLYTSVGGYTCEGYPGSFGHEEQDSKKFVEWGVDYIKLDWCTCKYVWWPFWNYRYRYELFAQALHEHDVVIAMCNWGFGGSAHWGKELAHTVRITFDVKPNEFMIQYIQRRGKALYHLGAVNGWNDLDSLEIGNGISKNLAKWQMYWWSVLKSPLIIGADVRTLDDEDVAILKTKSLIDYNQG